MDVLGDRVGRRDAVALAGEDDADLEVERQPSLDDARHAAELGPRRRDAGGIADRTLALAVVAETGRLDDERPAEGADGGEVGGVDRARRTAPTGKPARFEERLLGDAVLGDRHGPGGRGDDDVAGETLQRLPPVGSRTRW